MINVSVKKHSAITGLLIFMVAATGFAQADTDVVNPAQAGQVDTLSKRLIVLRGEVEDLGAELSLQRAEEKQRIATLLTQRSEVQASVSRELRNQDKLKTFLKKNRELARQAGADAGKLKPVVLNAIARIKHNVTDGLPFQLGERLAALDSMRDQLNSGVLSPPRAANRLWAFCEDELHLTRENGIYRQAVDIDGVSVLVDVARLGMILMYFRAPDQRYGMARKTSDGWRFEPADNEQDSKRIATLFESLQKQIRTGLFELPSSI
ncbi:MAG: DUF3450 domain-containing protein [Gammaproteobacteria bacterium]|nr:DUF3450 domain-containing protein [Gammaproteobacteria bacterium]